MESENLITVLRRERKILNELKSIATKKQIALVSNNREHLDECIKSEERMLPLIQKMENERLSAINEMYIDAGKSRKDYHLETVIEEFAELLPHEIIVEINTIHSEIKIVVEDLMKLNKQNMYLINHSRQFLNETISAILSSSEKSILDKKV